MSETVCPEATLETAFRPHEALVGALDTLAELGVITLESDTDVAAARLLAALDDVGACVAHENDTYDDERPRNIEDASGECTCPPDPFDLTSWVSNYYEAVKRFTELSKPVPEPAADEVCPFLIPYLKSDPWWKDGETYDVGGLQFTVVRGGK